MAHIKTRCIGLSLYRRVGRDDDAVPLLEETVAQLQAKYDDGVRHPGTLFDLAEAHSRLHRDDEAVEMLRQAMDYNFTWPSWLPDRPDEDASDVFSRLADNPRFSVLNERNVAKREHMAGRIRTMLAQHEVDELLSPLMAYVVEDSDKSFELMQIRRWVLEGVLSRQTRGLPKGGSDVRCREDDLNLHLRRDS